MEILRGLGEVTEKHRGAALTIGNFDGVHVGHQKIIRNVAAMAAERGVPSLAITFDPHPLSVLKPERCPRLLTPLEEKARLLLSYGIDMVLFVDFSREFANLRPDEFIKDVLVDRLGAKAVVVGHKYAFGKGKRGSTELLRRRGRKYGFKVKVVRNAKMFGKTVSSSRIRTIVSNGKVAKAARLLGRPYAVEGKVVKGAGRGARLLDAPTANIATRCEVIPKDGVYAVRAALDDRSFGRIYDGVANIGMNPTFHGAERTLEVHIFGYRGDLGGKTVRVGFIERLREERAYPSADALREQIARDMENAKEVLARNRDLKM